MTAVEDGVQGKGNGSSSTSSNHRLLACDSVGKLQLSSFTAVSPPPVHCPVPCMQVNVTADHRTIYGADVAEFLQTFAKLVEDPEQLTR